MSEDRRDLGSFPVSADAEAVAAFRAALGDEGVGSVLPSTFPMRWLAGADVRSALMGLIPEDDLVPVHEAQSFTYASDLRIGEPYRLSLAARRTAAPDRLTVDAVVLDGAGAEQVRMETVLRLISTAAGAA